MLARKIIRQASFVCWVLGIPFDHPRFENYACQIAKARMTRIDSKAAEKLAIELDELCESASKTEELLISEETQIKPSMELQNAI